MPQKTKPLSPVWIYPQDSKEWREKIIKEFKLHPVTAQILVSKGFSSLEQIHEYLYSKLPNLHNPFSLQQVDKAVKRIDEAIQNNEAILIYGDNDVDGMTGTALLTEYLQCLQANVHFFLSKRNINRDNLIIEALDFAREKECTLLITVDCGITAGTEIHQMMSHGIDVIITDHHEITGSVPNCLAILNPKLPDSTYPNRDLTGVGVAFKLAHALTNYFVEKGTISPKKIDLKRFLDLVALGTISDMAPLLGENRILVRYGMQQLRKGKRVGLSQLLLTTENVPTEITSFTVASKISPKLNSIGRIDDPQKGVDLLLIRNNQKAEKLAQELDIKNIERQKIEKTMSLEIEEMIRNHPEILLNRAIILHSDHWHPGVIAISSTRISKLFHRPTAMIAIENQVGKGSLRSIKEFPLLPALKSCSELLMNFGGHDAAAGLTIKEENIPKFTEKFTQLANEALSDKDVMTRLPIDASIQFKDITFDFMESLKLLEPFGNENQQPILYCTATQAWPPKVVGKTHLKLYLQQEDERMLEGIAFEKGFLSPSLRKKNLRLEIAFTPQINYFQGTSIQLLIKDLKILDQKG